MVCATCDVTTRHHQGSKVTTGCYRDGCAELLRIQTPKGKLPGVAFTLHSAGAAEISWDLELLRFTCSEKTDKQEV